MTKTEIQEAAHALAAQLAPYLPNSDANELTVDMLAVETEAQLAEFTKSVEWRLSFYQA